MGFVSLKFMGLSGLLSESLWASLWGFGLTYGSLPASS